MRPVVQVLRSPQTLGEFLVDPRQQPHRGEAGIAPFRHGGAAGMVLHALEDDAPLPDGDDAGDHADLSPAAPAACPARYASRGSPCGGPSPAACAAARQARLRPAPSRSGVPSCSGCELRSISASASRPMNERLPRKPPSKWPSSSAKATDIHRQPGPGERDRRDHAERAVQPAGLVLASRYGCRPADAGRAPWCRP